VTQALNWALVNSHTVDVWLVQLDAPRRAVLTPEEEERAARFRFEADRRHWANARSALRMTLAKYVAIPPGEIQFSFGPYGKPAAAGIEFNLSHAKNWATIAVSHGVPVGVDIECIRDNVEMATILERIGETQTRGSKEELFRIWTRREARTKALGSALMEIPPANVIATDILAPDGFAAAVALVDHWPAVRYCGGTE
jgi:4'-phosphopantetheinyl transferase